MFECQLGEISLYPGLADIFVADVSVTCPVQGGPTYTVKHGPFKSAAA
jgi:hypothetical protein